MKYIFGNWKMYLDYNETDSLSQTLAKVKFDSKKLTLAVFPSTLGLKTVVDNLSGSGIALGSQDHTWRPKGAYTGAVSALMFKDIGCQYALVGHSERRYVFNESDDDVRKKIEEALNVGLIPVVCIGETREDRDEGKREYRLKKQLMKAFADLNLNGGSIILAYEPVWAISKGGVGEPCSPEEADDVQGWIKNELKQYTDRETPVLYGGSVDEKNVLSYLTQTMIDGVLVGSASTKLENFSTLISIAEKI